MKFSEKLNKAFKNVRLEAIGRSMPKDLHKRPTGMSKDEQKAWNKQWHAEAKAQDKAALELAKKIATKVPPGGSAADLAISIGLMPKKGIRMGVTGPDKDRGQPIALTDVPEGPFTSPGESYQSYITRPPEVIEGDVVLGVKHVTRDVGSKKVLDKTDSDALTAGKPIHSSVKHVRSVLRQYGAKWSEKGISTREYTGKKPGEPEILFIIKIGNPIEMDNYGERYAGKFHGEVAQGEIIPKKDKVSKSRAKKNKLDAEAYNDLLDIIGES